MTGIYQRPSYMGFFIVGNSRIRWYLSDALLLCTFQEEISASEQVTVCF